MNTEDDKGGDLFQDETLRENLNRVRNKIIVLSGKGGVGKSTVAVNLALSLKAMGYKVGLLDIDIHGPSIPKMLGLEGRRLSTDVSGKLLPVVFNGSLKVMSIGFLLQQSHDAVIWRGPLKYSIIRQFLKDTLWEELDFLVIDSPPGTGDEPLTICQLIEDSRGAVVVTTPQEVALIDVKKSIDFCKKLNINILGIVENMSGFICPNCKNRIDIFKSGGGRQMAKEMDLPYLGSIPINNEIAESGDAGRAFSDESLTAIFNDIVTRVLEENNKVPADLLKSGG